MEAQPRQDRPCWAGRVFLSWAHMRSLITAYLSLKKKERKDSSGSHGCVLMFKGCSMGFRFLTPAPCMGPGGSLGTELGRRGLRLTANIALIVETWFASQDKSRHQPPHS